MDGSKDLSDMQWLLAQAPKADTLGTKKRKALKLTDLITRLDRRRMPVTIGLFGSWGSGKTTVLAYAAKILEDSPHHAVIYFNAWKYSSFTEVVPALIYKILSTASSMTPRSTLDRLGTIMLGLGKKYAESIGVWSKAAVGIDFVELVKDSHDVAAMIRDSSNPAGEIAKEYSTQIDRSQKMLGEVCRECSKVIVVLIDELDRCDPGEAFDIIKQLRVFFTMLDVPLSFVLSVNPDPIGQAIKHQFGLESEWGDYEARKILEKFVDHYFEMDDNETIIPHVTALWSSVGLDVHKSCFVAQADARLRHPDYNEDIVKHASFNECILGSNPIYGNRRLLAKCLDRAQISPEGTDLALTTWHLEIAAQAYPHLRETIALLTHDLGAIAEKAHLDLLETLADAGAIDASSGDVINGCSIKSDKGSTAFSVYRSAFWECARKTRDELRTKSDREARALQELMDDPRKMEFVLVGLMQPLGKIHEWRKSSRGFEVPHWETLYNHKRLAYLLYNY